MQYRWAAVLYVSVLLAACGSDADTAQPDAGGPDGEQLGGPEAVFVAPIGGAAVGWGTLPWPSDLYLDGEGRVALREDMLPVGAEHEAGAVAGLARALRRLDGAGVTTNLYFPVLGGVDPATLPGQVKLIDLDAPGTPSIPLDVTYRADLGAIVASPPLGVVLAANHRHGAFVTDQVRDAGGLPLRPSAHLRAVLRGQTDGNVDLSRAAASLAPLLEVLPAGTRDGLAAATVFRTRDVARETLVLRDKVHASPPRIVAIDRVYGPDESELDELLGDAAPGQGPGVHWDQPSSPIAHEHLAVVIQGRIAIDSFVAPGETVPFTMTLPRQASLADVPVVVVVHGIGSTRSRAAILADTLAAHGMATLAIDLPFHGSRGLEPFDKKHDYTGAVGPDGWGDNVGLAAHIAFFHIVERDGVAAAPHDAGVILDHFRQSTAEVMALGAYVQAGPGDLVADAVRAAGLPEVTFSDDVGLLGYSFGSFFAAAAVAVDPTFDVALLGVPPSGFPYPALVHSVEYGSQFNDLLFGVYGLAERVIFGDDARDPRFDPVIDLLGQVVEEGEGIAYAPGVRDGLYRAGDVPDVLLVGAWGDESVPNTATEHLAAALGAVHVTADAPAPPEGLLRYVPLASQPAPHAGNAAGGAATIALSMWYPAGHGLLLGLIDRTTQEAGLPPFVPLPETLYYANPVGPAQEQAATFLQDALLGDGAPRVLFP